MHIPTLLSISLFSAIFTSPTSATPLSHRHRLPRPSGANKPILPRETEVASVGSRDLLDDRDDRDDPDFLDFPDFPPGFPFDSSGFPFDDEPVPIPAPDPAPPTPDPAPPTPDPAPPTPDPATGPAPGANNAPARDCASSVTITQAEVQTTTETATVTITAGEAFLDGLFEGKQEYITLVVTTTETEFAPGQTVTITASEVQGENRDEPTVTITVTEKPEPATVTVTEVQTVTAIADSVDTGAGNNPGTGDNKDIPPPPEPPAPPAPPPPPPPPAPPVIEEPTPPITEEPAPPAEGGQGGDEGGSDHPDFVDLGVLELDGDRPQPTIHMVAAAPSHSDFHNAAVVPTPTPLSVDAASSSTMSSSVVSNAPSTLVDIVSELNTVSSEIATVTLTRTTTVVVTSTRTFTHVRPTAFRLPAIEFDDE